MEEDGVVVGTLVAAAVVVVPAAAAAAAAVAARVGTGAIGVAPAFAFSEVAFLMVEDNAALLSRGSISSVKAIR